MDGPVRIIPTRPSARLLGLRVLVHLLALVACAASGLALFAFPSALLVAGSLVREIHAHVRARPLHLGSGRDGWWLEESGGRLPVEVLGGTRVWPGLVALQLRSAAGRRDLLLAADSASPEDFRRLRAALRLGAARSGTQDRVEGLR